MGYRTKEQQLYIISCNFTMALNNETKSKGFFLKQINN